MITMTKSEKRRGRPPVQREEMLHFIRKQVVTGVWEPGFRLPPRTWFEQKFSAAPATVQKAFEILCAEGVLKSEPRKYTCVDEAPPHLNRYGLVLYGTEKQENLFSRSLVQAAELLRRREGRNLEVFFDLDCRQDSPDHRELVYGVEHHLFAGLFFASYPKRLLGTPILNVPGLPRVMFSQPSSQLPELIALDLPPERLAERALAYLAARGARRIAVLLPATKPQPDRRELILRRASALGLECPPDYCLELYSDGAPLVTPVVELLFNRRNRERPDGFLVGDDNFLPYALAGLRRALGAEAAGVRVVSHANYPDTAQSPELPVKFFYVNVLEILKRGIELIDRQRRGQEVRSEAFDFAENPEP